MCVIVLLYLQDRGFDLARRGWEAIGHDTSKRVDFEGRGGEEPDPGGRET